MKIYKLFLLAITLFMLTSCEKEPDDTIPWGTMSFYNTQDLDKPYTMVWYDHKWNYTTTQNDTTISFRYDLGDTAIFICDAKGLTTISLNDHLLFSEYHCGKAKWIVYLY